MITTSSDPQLSQATAESQLNGSLNKVGSSLRLHIEKPLIPLYGEHIFQLFRRQALVYIPQGYWRVLVQVGYPTANVFYVAVPIRGFRSGGLTMITLSNKKGFSNADAYKPHGMAYSFGGKMKAI